MMTDIERSDGVQDWMVYCDNCGGWHHPEYHEPFRWNRRVLVHAAWLDTKRAMRAWLKVFQ